MKDAREPFLAYRDRIVHALAIVTAIGVTPFAANNFLQGRLALGAFSLLFVAILAVDAWAIYRGRAIPIPLWTLVLPVMATLVGAFLTPHYLALAWAYPLVIFFYFILARAAANVVAAMILLTATGLSWAYIDSELATRLGATLLLTAVLTNIFVSLIEGLYRQLLEQAITDPLTQAFNRRQMDVELFDMVQRAGRGEARPSLVMLDIDRFKDVNDRYGHAAGDSVLKAVASIARERARKIDHLFRSGGEEFVLALPATNLAGARQLAEDIRDAVARARMISGCVVTVSAGVSELQEGDTAESWLKRADDALYAAKRAGRDRVMAPAAARTADEAVPG